MGWTGAIAASLHHSSQQHWIPKLLIKTRMKPASSWMLVHGLVSAVPQQELPIFFVLFCFVFWLCHIHGFFFFFFFFCHVYSMQKFLGQGSNLNHISDQTWILNLLSHQGTPATLLLSKAEIFSFLFFFFLFFVFLGLHPRHMEVCRQGV